MYEKLKRGAGLLAVFALAVNLSGNVLAAVSEYTPGKREISIYLRNYEHSDDDYNLNAYDRTQNMRIEDRNL